MILAPGEERRRSAAVSPPRVRVADSAGEELQEAYTGLVASRSDQGGYQIGRGDGSELRHDQLSIGKAFSSRSVPVGGIA